jgi:hypothetical protein
MSGRHGIGLKHAFEQRCLDDDERLLLALARETYSRVVQQSVEHCCGAEAPGQEWEVAVIAAALSTVFLGLMRVAQC